MGREQTVMQGKNLIWTFFLTNYVSSSLNFDKKLFKKKNHFRPSKGIKAINMQGLTKNERDRTIKNQVELDRR